MDDILLSDSNADTLERWFEEVKNVLPKWGLQIAPEKIQRGDSVNYVVPVHDWITLDLIIHLNKTLDGDKDLNNTRELTVEAEKELMVVDEKL